MLALSAHSTPTVSHRSTPESTNVEDLSQPSLNIPKEATRPILPQSKPAARHPYIAPREVVQPSRPSTVEAASHAPSMRPTPVQSILPGKRQAPSPHRLKTPAPILLLGDVEEPSQVTMSPLSQLSDVSPEPDPAGERRPYPRPRPLAARGAKSKQVNLAPTNENETPSTSTNLPPRNSRKVAKPPVAPTTKRVTRRTR